MKQFTKVLCVVATLVLALCCLTACQPSSTDEQYYVIGATGPLTGDASSYGIGVQRGAQIAIDELNEKGGLNGVKFKFIMIDDKADAKEAQNGFNTLFEQDMQASIGSVTSGSCCSFAEQANIERVFVLTPSASDEKVIAKGNQTFRICFGDDQQARLAADMLADEGYTKIGIIYDTSDTYSSGVYTSFAARLNELKASNGSLEYVVYSFDADNKKDFTTQVEGLKASNCDVLFLPMYYTEAGLIAKAAAAKDFNVPILGSDGLDGVAGQLDETVTAHIRYVTPFDVNSTDSKVVSFVNTFKAKYNATPDQFAADGYDTIMAIYEAMKFANVNDANISASDLCEKLVSTFNNDSFSYSGLTGSDMKWPASDNGGCQKAPLVVDVQ